MAIVVTVRVSYRHHLEVDVRSNFVNKLVNRNIGIIPSILNKVFTIIM